MHTTPTVPSQRPIEPFLSQRKHVINSASGIKLRPSSAVHPQHSRGDMLAPLDTLFLETQYPTEILPRCLDFRDAPLPYDTPQSNVVFVLWSRRGCARTVSTSGRLSLQTPPTIVVAPWSRTTPSAVYAFWSSLTPGRGLTPDPCISMTYLLPRAPPNAGVVLWSFCLRTASTLRLLSPGMQFLVYSSNPSTLALLPGVKSGVRMFPEYFITPRSRPAVRRFFSHLEILISTIFARSVTWLWGKGWTTMEDNPVDEAIAELMLLQTGRPAQAVNN
ncbi:hypothetical protein GGX14DRAFT_674581 [Mycena pura]|uniref:Uncharacterized protein n=1 Tax=Mycena pura TaxID=153505 RepID=A0AAD6V2E4_9AGAR|nr:hypothetical protein GGX14DRAFT_674581 [Mycena pura]